MWRNAGSIALNANNIPSNKHFESKLNNEIIREYGGSKLKNDKNGILKLESQKSTMNPDFFYYDRAGCKISRA